MPSAIAESNKQGRNLPLLALDPDALVTPAAPVAAADWRRFQSTLSVHEGQHNDVISILIKALYTWRQCCATPYWQMTLLNVAAYARVS